METVPVCVTLLKIYSRRPMTKVTIGGNEDMAPYMSSILQVLCDTKPEKVTTLGFATVKDDPQHYFIYDLDPLLFIPFQNLQVTLRYETVSLHY